MEVVENRYQTSNIWMDTMNNSVCVLTVKSSIVATALIFLCASCAPVARIPSRSMGVNAGPETVFEQPVAEVFAPLSDAVATGNNGRVGNELVFWEYQLANTSKVNFYVCIMQEEINCEARIRAICPAGGSEIDRRVIPGNVRHLNCRAVGIANTGDLRPNCDDSETLDDLLAGILQCQ